MPKQVSGQGEILSPEPIVHLRSHFRGPIVDAISAAKTCYSPYVVSPEDVEKRPQDMKRVGRTTYEGGHHTVYQHEMFEFEVSNVSRAFVHDFLHAHPFYNSSQESQRYVQLKELRATTPPIEGPLRGLYERTVLDSYERYRQLTGILFDYVMQEYRKRVMVGEPSKKVEREAREKAMEAARYALSIAAHTHLIHTIDGVTLWRYYRLQNLSWEASRVVSKMVSEVEGKDPSFFEHVEGGGALGAGETLEYKLHQSLQGGRDAEEFVEEFDRGLHGYSSKLIAWTQNAEGLIGDAVRHVLGLPKAALSDEEATGFVLNPGKNPYMADPLNLSMVSPLMRSLNHLHYTFRKKMSHVGDSQDQRHRTVPGSRPLIAFVDSRGPDYITPLLIEREPAARQVYDDWMKEVWERKNQLLDDGIKPEYATYVLPGALAIRFEETGSIMNLWYKYMNRSCLRAQEEIWRVTMEEIRQINDVHPSIGRFLGPPCFVRKMYYLNEPLPEELGKVKYCNQGKLYCRQPVWLFYPKVTLENILKV